MKFFAVFVVCALAFTHASVAPYHSYDLGLPSSKLIQGPSSRSTIIGPDGSAISSFAPGGSILAEEHSGLIARTAPLVAPVAYTAPIVAPSYPFIPEARTFAHTGYASPLLARSAPFLGHHAGFVGRTGLDTVVAGPSGTIATSRGLGSSGLLAGNVIPTSYAGYNNGLYW